MFNENLLYMLHDNEFRSTNELLPGKPRGIKPYRFYIALQVIRVIRVICEICGLKAGNKNPCVEFIFPQS